VTGVGQRIRKRDRFLRRLNDASKAAFYVDRPTTQTTQTPEMTETDSSVAAVTPSSDPPPADDHFASAMADIEGDHELREKVRLGLQQWIGARSENVGFADWNPSNLKLIN
jgi:hypothetical protein